MEWIREPQMAGRFYPGNPETLSQLLRGWLAPPLTPKIHPRAVLVPHAGYFFSGAIASKLFQQIEVPKNIVVLCPNHTGKGPRISLWPQGYWKTPLGKVPIAEGLAKEITSLGEGQVTADREAHLYEHAIEVQLPFLQQLNPAFCLVPIVLSRLRWDNVLAFSKVLAQAIDSFEKRTQESVLVVASSDMSHFLSAVETKKADAPAIAAIEQFAPQRLYDVVTQNQISMCGYLPATCAMLTAQHLGATQSKLVAYGHSGEASGDMKKVVGYASAYFT